MIRRQGFHARALGSIWYAAALIAAIALSGVGVATGSLNSTVARDCRTYEVAARIANRRVCLRDLEPCKNRLERSYERFGFYCSQGRLIATWRRLRRPLHLPNIDSGSACPTSSVDQRIDFEFFGVGPGIGDGPVYPAPFDPNYRQPLDVLTVPAGWHGGKEALLILPAYRGPVLIRGRQLDGAGAVTFASNEIRGAPRLPNTSTELRIPVWRAAVVRTFFFLEPPGCFAYQIDGTTFTKTVVFQVTLEATS